MEKRQCTCGITFTPNNYRQKKCNACRFGVSQGNSKHRYCVQCGSIFSPKNSWDVYCGDSCRKSPQDRSRPCNHCGHIFQPTTNQRYCADCRDHSKYAQRFAPRERACVVCGTCFTPIYRRRVTCSERCYAQHYYQTHKENRVPQSAESRRLQKLNRTLRKHSQDKAS